MKLRIYSDLHTEFGKFKIPEPCKETILVLAGDIGVGCSSRAFVANACLNFKAVVLVLGNHEFYNQNMGELLNRWDTIAEETEGLHVLMGDGCTIGGIDFFGDTMWTDLNQEDIVTRTLVNYSMNDFRCIRLGEEVRYGYGSKSAPSLHADQSIVMHKLFLDRLSVELDRSTDNPLVVVTHHCPSKLCIDEARYGKSELNYAYYSNLEHLVDHPRIKYWISGHTHNTVRSGKLLMNCRGYVGHELNDKFDPMFEVTI